MGSGPGSVVFRRHHTPFPSAAGSVGIFGEIRALPGGLQKLTEALYDLGRELTDLVELQRRVGPVEARLEELERYRASWEATMQAEMQKAESTYKAAANAESRSRTMLRHSEKLSDPLDLEGEEVQEALPGRHAPAGEEEGVPPLRLGVAGDNKAYLQRLKFG